MKSFGVSAVLCLISIVFFAVAAFDGSIADLNLIPMGLAFFAAAHLVP